MKSIERHIIVALIRDMRAQGYLVAAVWDGEQYTVGDTADWKDGTTKQLGSRNENPIMESILRPLTDAEALHAIDTVDQSTLHFTNQNAMTWGDHGVLIILGNGEDVLVDYHNPMGEPFCGVVEAIYDRINKGQLL